MSYKMGRDMFVGTILLLSIVSTFAQSPRVRVREGTIVGKSVLFTENTHINVMKTVNVFLGVPYADPPVRFQRPVQKSPWRGILNATEFKPACMQPIYYNFPVVSEDCLYLNVYAPQLPQRAAVLVWIHGGGFVTGSAMTYMYYGVPLVAVGDVIVVTINYRVGIFSRFSSGDSQSTGNYGMLDQVAALQWVHDNIEAFGGDRNRVTIFGESAGSASVDFLMLSRLSRGLFNQAIMQSGNSFSQWAFRDTPAQTDANRVKRLGSAMQCPTSPHSALLMCLRAKDATRLLRAAGRIYGAYPLHVDGIFLEDTPTNIYKSGEYTRCPVIAGYNKDEGTLILNFAYRRYLGKQQHPPVSFGAFKGRVTNLLSRAGYTGAVLLNATLEKYTKWSLSYGPIGDYFQNYVDIGTDVDYSCTTDKVLRARARADDKLFKYVLTHEPSKSIFQFRDILPSTPWLAAGHGEDLPFVFGMSFIDELYYIRGHNITEEEKALSAKLMTFWTNFAKTGDPSKATINAGPAMNPLTWPRFTVPELRHKELSPELGEGRAARADQCHFLNEYLPGLKASITPMSDLQRQWREDYTAWRSSFAQWRTEYKRSFSHQNDA